MKKTILASMLAVMMATPAFAAESTDIVIIGSGGAGLSSAITATEKGAKVIVLEKMAYFGGNSNRSEGGMNAAGTKQHRNHIPGCTELPKSCYSVHSRHHHIHYDTVIIACLKVLQCLHAIIHRINGKIIFFKIGRASCRERV